jgi:hypothetical protein
MIGETIAAHAPLGLGNGMIVPGGGLLAGSDFTGSIERTDQFPAPVRDHSAAILFRVAARRMAG